MSRNWWEAATWTAICVLLLNLVKKGNALHCFRCNSVDGSDAQCEDEFHPYTSSNILDRDCKVGILDYHSFYCVKIKGTKKATGEKIVIRTCSVENWGSQCGDIFFQTPIPNSEETEVEALDGCVESCNFDGCNKSGQISYSVCVLSTMTLLTGLTHWIRL